MLVKTMIYCILGLFSLTVQWSLGLSLASDMIVGVCDWMV